MGAVNQAARAAARDADVVVALNFYPKGYTPEPIVFAEIDAHQAALRGWKGKTLSTGVTSVR